MATPAINKKFKMFPIPKNLKTRNDVNPVVAKKPLLALVKRIEEVKRRVINKLAKKIGIAPKVFGSTK